VHSVTGTKKWRRQSAVSAQEQVLCEVHDCLQQAVARGKVNINGDRLVMALTACLEPGC
jgi:hypothetical protein